MGIGLSFGKKKGTETRDTSINKTETGTQNTTQQTTGRTSGTETTTSNQTNTSTGNTTTTNVDNTRSDASTVSTQTGRTSNLSAGLVSGIEGGIEQLLGQVLGGDRQAISGGIASLQNFDIGSFVDNIMGGATQRVNRQLEGSVNSLANQVGGTAGENSNVAILSQQLANDINAVLSGTTITQVRDATYLIVTEKGEIFFNKEKIQVSQLPLPLPPVPPRPGATMPTCVPPGTPIT